MPELVVGDVERLRQIVQNLLGNALKFTKAGEIILRAATESQDDEAVILHFTVLDTGVWNPREKQEVIFEAFSQVDGSFSRKFGGTGLGLTISARLVELIGGRIWVDSEPDRGSIFHFTAQFKEA